MPASVVIDRQPGDDAVVAANVERVASFLDGEDRKAAAETLREMLREPASKVPSIHVAGEATCGKSCLVNALLGVPNLSPTGANATTSAPIRFHHAPEQCATLLRYGTEAEETVEIERARSLATVEGNPANEENIRAISIGLDRPLLHRFELVDTPGLGGLDSGHGALTIQSLNHADALIFVLEADAQIRPSEVQFLIRAAARIETVIFALSKVDVYLGWRETLNRDIALLRERAPRFADCPVVAVSSTLAIRALTAGDREQAGVLREQSGLSELERVIDDRVLTRVSALGRANRLRTALSLLGPAQRDLGRRLAVMTTETGPDALLTEQARLQELGEQGAEWQQVVDSGIRELTLERQQQTGLRTLEIRRRYEQRLKTINKKDLDALPSELIADLTALGSELNEIARDRLLALIHTALAGIEQRSTLESEVTALTGEPLPAQLDSASLEADEIKHAARSGLLSNFVGGRALPLVMSGSSLGIAAGVWLALLAPPVAIGLGFSMGCFFAFEAFKSRNRQIFATEFTTWMRDQIAKAQLTLTTTFNLTLIDLQAQLRQAIQATLTDRRQEINETIAAARAMDKAGPDDRQNAARDLAERQAVAQRLRSDTKMLLDGVRRISLGDGSSGASSVESAERGQVA